MNAAMPLPEDRAWLAGRYEIVEKIGSGTLGEVFLARDHSMPLAPDVCIKRLTAVRATDATDYGHALREEARLLARVRHRNIVALLGIEPAAGASGIDANGASFLVLEWVDGIDLRALCRARAEEGGPGALPTPVAVHVACAVLHALAAVQRGAPGLIHRDVTPANVLLARSGDVKLADFGIALFRGGPRSIAAFESGASAVGTPGYMAPEQIRGEPIDTRADLFAVGVILCELLTRRRPWRPSRMQGMDELRAIASGDVLSMHALAPDLDRHLAGAIDRLLAPNPRNRFADALAALRALAPFSAGELGPLRLASILERCRQNA